jgi:hypothetical protein
MQPSGSCNCIDPRRSWQLGIWTLVGDNFVIPSKLCEDYGGVVASYGTSSYRPTAMMSRRHSNAVGTGNFSYFSKKMNF